MWERLLKLENNTLVKAMVPSGEEAPTDLSDFGLDKALFSLNASDFKLYTEKVAKFIDKAKSTSVDAALGIVIAERLDAQAKVIVTDNDMLATMEITGAFGGNGLEWNGRIYPGHSIYGQMGVGVALSVRRFIRWILRCSLIVS